MAARLVIRKDCTMHHLPDKTAYIFAALCGGALIAGIAGFIIDTSATSALIAAVIMLVIAQLILFFSNSKTSLTDDKILSAIEELQLQISAMQTRMSENAGLISQASRPQLPSDNPVAIRPETPDIELLDRQKLFTYLEPVIDVKTGKTAAYRAQLAFARTPDNHVLLHHMSQQIDQQGIYGDLDMRLLESLVDVINRLASRNRHIPIFCQISRHSFASTEFLQELTRFLHDQPKVARSLVIEIAQSELAQLDDEAMAGLAYLARIGAVFCLGGAGLESPDLASLASLGFKYLDLDMDNNTKTYSVSAFVTGGRAFAMRNDAKQHDIAIIGSSLTRKSQHDAFRQFMDFARGPVYSPPRLVKTDKQQSASFSRAA